MTRRGAAASMGVTVGYSDGIARPFPGPALLARREAIAYADAHGLKVRTLSTPETIAGDLRGRARPTSRADGGAAKYAREPLPYESPEETWLRGAQRLDLYDRPDPPRARWWPLRIFRRREVTP